MTRILCNQDLEEKGIAFWVHDKQPILSFTPTWIRREVMVGCWRENLCCKVFKCCWFQMVLDNCLQVPCSLLIADCLLLRENWDAVCKHIYERTTTAQPPLVNCSLFLHIIKSAFFSHRFISLDFMTSDSLTGIC